MTFPFPAAAQAAPSPTIDWAARAATAITLKVRVGKEQIVPTTREQIEWCYAILVRRLAGSPSSVTDINQRITLLLETFGNEFLIDPSDATSSVAEAEAQVKALIPTRLLFRGQPCTGTADQVDGFYLWLLNNLVVLKSIADPAGKAYALLNWITSLKAPFEADDTSRMSSSVLAPANPISTQTAPQVAAPALPAAPAATTPAEEPEEAAATGELIYDPVDKTSYKSLRGFKRHVTMTHKVDWPAFCQAHALDPATGKPGAGAPVGTPSQTPTVPPPVSPVIPPMLGQQPVQQPAQATIPFAPPQPPAQAPIAFPTPPQVVQQASPPAFVMPTPPAMPALIAPPMFQPTVQPSGTIIPGTVVPAAVPATVPLVANTPALPMFQPNAPEAPRQLSRDQIAQLLGGPVDLLILKLSETAGIPLTGRIDANQLALLAEKNAREEMRLTDLAQGSYGAGKQAAQRHFGKLLSDYPLVYLLMNGFEPILGSDYIAILIARVTKAYQVTERGQSHVELKLS